MSWRQAVSAMLLATTSNTRKPALLALKLPIANFQFPIVDDPLVFPWGLGVGTWELTSFRLRRNFGHSYGMQPFEKLPRRMTLESRIRRLDDEKEAIGRRAPEGVDVENRVIRLRQLVQRPHADKRRERRSENRRLKGHRDELRPAIERAIADVHRVGHHRGPVLEAETGKPAEDATEQHEQRQPRSLEIERLVELLNRDRRIGVHLAIAGEARLRSGVDECRRVFKFGHQAVERWFGGVCHHITRGVPPSASLQERSCASRRWRSPAGSG